jgi:CRP-like cAMP-binding protein
MVLLWVLLLISAFCLTAEKGKEAVVAIHGKGDFFGEGCLTGQRWQRR